MQNMESRTKTNIWFCKHDWHRQKSPLGGPLHTCISVCYSSKCVYSSPIRANLSPTKNNDRGASNPPCRPTMHRQFNILKSPFPLPPNSRQCIQMLSDSSTYVAQTLCRSSRTDVRHFSNTDTLRTRVQHFSRSVLIFPIFGSRHSTDTLGTLRG